jgi:hypothetical protein
VILAALVAGIGPACSKSGPDYGSLACLDGWPTAPAPAKAASLAVTPSILWQVNVGQIAPPGQPGVALSADRIIASGGAGWVALDRRTGARLATGSTRPDPQNYFLGAPVVDEQGGIYVQSHVSLYAFATDGALRWSWAIPGQSQSSEPWGGDFMPSLIGNGQLLFGSSAQPTQLLAFTSAPKQLWSSGLGTSSLIGHWGLGYDGTASFVLDLRTGKGAGRLRTPNGHDVVALLPLSGRGILVMDRDNATALTLVMLDTCGKAVWSLGIPGSKVCTGASVVGPGEIIYMGIGSCNGGQPGPEIVGIGPDGTIVSGPVPSTRAPWIAGSDGTLYTINLNASTPPSNLVALSPALETLWTLDLPGVFGNYATAALADDGILYAQMSTNTGNEIIAVQTTSPGLASSSWPSRRHDNRSSNWAGGSF